MKFNFKKIASVLASVVMLGSTLGIAAAANYPAPFIAGGTANVAVVVGASAASSDFIAAADLGSNLQVELAKQTATTGTTTGATATGGDSVNLATSARKIYFGDSINAAKTSLSSSEMPSVLGDGKVIDLRGTEYKYTQTITPGIINSTFGTSGGDLTDPALIIQVGSDAAVPLYNYTLSFNKNINVTDDTNVQGQKVKILGVDYVIGASSTNTSLYLYGAGQSLTLVGGETKTVTIAEKEHVIELVSTASTTSAKLTVDGVSKTVAKGSSYAYAGDINVYVKDITHPAFAGDVRNIDLIIGANTLLLQNGQSVKQGADQTTIKGTSNTITAAGTGLISGFTVQVALPTSAKDHISSGGSFTDPVFGGLKVQFAGVAPELNSSARANVKIDTDNNQYAYVAFTSARAGSKGEQRVIYVYDNNTASTAIQPLLAHQTIAANKGKISVYEGESLLVNDWAVINQADSGTILNVDDISVDTATSGTVTFTDVITGESQKITLTNSTAGQGYIKTGVNFFGGNGYTITVPPNSATSVNITWSAAGTRTLFPRIKLKDGGWIALMASTAIVNGTNIIYPDGQTTIATAGTRFENASISQAPNNGIIWNNTHALSGNDGITNNTVAGIGGAASCVFNSSRGPAILYMEPKKWDDSSYGNYICIPLTTTGSTEISIADPVLNFTIAGLSTYATYSSDTYKKAIVDKYGAFVTKEDRTNENGVATIKTPTSQMYLDVLFTSQATSVTAGTSAGGTVAELGSVTVKDSELSSVSSKNLIVVGGSCINTVAAKILGSTTPLCGAAFTAKAGVAADQFLVKAVNAADAGGTDGKVALLVAGYEAADTAKAVKYLTTEKPKTDVNTTLKKVTATLVDVA